MNPSKSHNFNDSIDKVVEFIIKIVALRVCEALTRGGRSEMGGIYHPFSFRSIAISPIPGFPDFRACLHFPIVHLRPFAADHPYALLPCFV